MSFRNDIRASLIYVCQAYGCFTLLMICSLPPIRRHHYEAFYFLHILFVPLTLVMSALHHPPLAWWCWAALALWVGERSYRFTWWLNTNGFLGGTQAAELSNAGKKHPSQVKPDTLPMHALGQAHAVGKLPTLPRIDPNATAPAAMTGIAYSPPPGYVHAELLPGKTVRVRIVTPGFLSWAPGQHFLINIPAISSFTSHPFTVASVCDAQSPHSSGRELVFFIRAKKGWTKDLWDTVAGLTARGMKHPKDETLPAQYRMPQKGVLMRAYVDGPFGSAARAKWGEHSTVLLMAGGSGVSFALSILEYMCMCMAGRDGRELGGRPGGYGKPNFKTRRVRFVWIVREFSESCSICPVRDADRIALGHIHWCAHYLKRCMDMVPPSELQIDIFVTNAKPMLRALSQRRPADTLVPPTPQFVIEEAGPAAREKRNSHSPSSSVGSFETDEPDDEVDLSYYESDVANEEKGELGHDEHILDLTNFEDDDDTALPGEDLINMAVKEEGRARRSLWRRSFALGGGKVERDNRASWHGTAGRSTARLLDDGPSTQAMRSLAPIPEASSSRVQLPSPLASTPTPTSAAPLLGDTPRFTFPPTSPSPLRSPSPPTSGKRVSFAQSRAESPRPASAMSEMSQWSNAHSLAALVSEAAAEEKIRLELEEEEVLDISVVAERARAGRPVFQRILADEVELAKGSLIVGCE